MKLRRAITLAALLLAIPSVAIAAHRFDDVPTSHTFHGAIDWMADNGITLGCNAAGTEYCPNDSVTRGQMAAFMYRISGNDPSVQPSVAASSALEANHALTASSADQAANAVLLDGVSKNGYLPSVSGLFWDWNTALPIGGEEPVLIWSGSVTAGSANSSYAEVAIDGTFQLVDTASTLATDYYLACWVAPEEQSTYVEALSNPSLVSVSAAAGTAGLNSAAGYLHFYPVSTSFPMIVPAGSTGEYYVYCVDFFADDFPSSPRFELTGFTARTFSAEIDGGTLTDAGVAGIREVEGARPASGGSAEANGADG